MRIWYVPALLGGLLAGCAKKPAPAGPPAPSATKTTDVVATRRASDVPRFRVIGTNDFHGALEPRPDNAGARRGGAAALAGAIAKARRECAPPTCESIVLDGGDMFQGTPASNLAFGRP